MGTTLGFRFPLGRYHATPWDRSVNEGAAEWPPSPWRLLRALIATWHTRWPDLPVVMLDGLLDALGDPPSYWTPATRPAHTRHYLPDLDHKKGETGGTDLTLDPFLSIGRSEELLVRWEADLDRDQREVLAKLAELMPYLGRAESVCEARLLSEDPLPDEYWWRPGTDGARRTRLLIPQRPVSRTALEVTTVDVRKQRRTLPPGAVWATYAAAEPSQPPQDAQREVACVEAVRFAVTGRVPLKSTHGVLLADDAHRVIGDTLAIAGVADERRRALLGTGGAQSGHNHAHWIPVADGHQRGASVLSLILWVPQQLRGDEVAAIINLPALSGHRGGRASSEGYEVRGFPQVRLLFQAAGPIGQVAPELRGRARRWRSLTPYLPVRHRKREPLGEYVAADVNTELRYRDLPSAAVTPVDPEGGMPDRWAREFRRYRLTERMDRSRPGLGLRLEFADEVEGPLLLGQLSHFGYGIFAPEPG
jgi:CRISPR-associated protein Csb2